MASRPRQRDLTQGPVARTLLLFALPTLGVNILQSLNGSVNAIWVGNFLGESALAATSNANLVMFLMFSSVFGFAMATTILIGQAMGKRDVRQVRRTLGTSAGLFIIAAALIATLGWIFAPDLLHLLATPKNAFPFALSYLRVIFLGMPMQFLMILLSSSLRGTGDALTPLWTTILNVILDAGLNPVFILGLGGMPQMGIAGSAFATLIAGTISTLMLLIIIYRRDLTIRLRGAELTYLRPDPAITRVILSKGLPMGLSMIILSSSALAMIGLVNREGVDTTAAFGVMNQLWTYIQMPALAIGGAVSAMAAQNIGAGRWDRIGRIARAGVGVNVIMTSALLLIITVAERPLLGLFLTPDSPAIPIARHMGLIIGWSFILFGVSMVLSSVVRANGAVMVPLVILILSAFGGRVGLAFILHPRFGAEAIWWSFVVGSLLSAALTAVYYLRGSWKSAQMAPTAPLVPRKPGLAQGAIGD